MDKRHYGAKDLLKFRFLSDPQMSPDGTKTAYVLTRIDPETKEYRTGIYLHTQGAKDVCIVAEGTRPVWSPDGKQLAFLSSRSGSSQVWLTCESLSEPRKLTAMRYGVTDIAWSPDGSRLLLVSATAGEDDLEVLLKEMDSAEKQAVLEKTQHEATRIDQLPYRGDEVSGLLPQRKRQLWILDMETEELERITDSYTHIFSRAQTTPVWAPDGRHIVYTSSHEAKSELSPYLAANASDLYIYSLETLESRRAVHGNGTAAYPTWSPDSRCLAYFWYDDIQYLTSSTLPKLYRLDVITGEQVCLTPEQDISVHVAVQSDLLIGSMPVSPVWTQHGQILFWGAREGRANVYAVCDRGGGIVPVTQMEGSVFGFSADAAGRKLAVAVMDTEKSMNLWECQTENGICLQCTDLNEKLMAECKTAAAEEFYVTTDDGQKIHAWLMKPTDLGTEESYPLVLHIHGGPHLLYGNAFNFEFQLMAASGIGVLYANPRGSAGYGQEFLRGCCGDFGGGDYRDLMAVVDAALQKDPQIDSERLGVTGLSYGGFMTNWVVGHTNRFKAAVTKNCLSNLLSFAGVSDIGYFFLEGEQLGNPWRDRERMAAMSPLTYVENIETPLLILHTLDDQRCPIEQSEQLYAAMKYLEKKAVFLRYPSGNHLMYRLGKPTLRTAWLKDTMSWFEEYLLPVRISGREKA
jgi:dipeptidyl aminopeptidase/acylaminoacyl peptidase